MNLENLGEKARRTRTENKNFFKLIKKNRLRELDDFVHYLHEETFSHINCLECANCCRTLGPRITDKDIERMSKKLRMKPHEIVNSYLRIDEDNDYVFKENCHVPFWETTTIAISTKTVLKHAGNILIPTGKNSTRYILWQSSIQKHVRPYIKYWNG